MLKNSSFGIALFINFIIILLWYFVSYIISKHIGTKRVDYKKFPYRIIKAERKGMFYKENFGIDKWYRLLPTDYNQAGITENSLKDDNTLVLKQERLPLTCRSELFAIVNCLYVVCAAILDAPYLAFILGSIVVLANLPFIAASRYCRCLILNEIINKRKQIEDKARLAESTPNVFELDIF